MSEPLTSNLNNPYPSPVINQTLNWLHYSSDAAKAAFLSLSLPSERLIVWLVMSGRVGETSLRDYGERERERERERWHRRPLSSRLPVAIVTGCRISCWRSIRGVRPNTRRVCLPQGAWPVCHLNHLDDNNNSHTHTHTHSWTPAQSDGRPANTMTLKSSQKLPRRAAALSTQSWINPNHNWLGTSEPSLQQRDVRATAARFHITTWLTIMWATNPPQHAHRGSPPQVDKTPRHTMWLI